ncbi:MAG: putative heme-binding domain-containing protein [Planctomycetaceae bacterium]|jgi:putative heme-binding domain-containing protein
MVNWGGSATIVGLFENTLSIAAEDCIVLRRVAFVIVLLAVVPLRAEDGFVKLFNGKDLTGWKGDSELWSVEDGCITGKTKGKDHLSYNKFLIWDGVVSDFEFHCEFRLEGNNNSGVQYRSKHDKTRGDWVVVGYQADIHPKAEFTGMLYDEKGRGIVAKRGQKVVVTTEGKKDVTNLDGEFPAIDLTKWHELTIIAQGNRLIHKLDGKVAVDITDNQESEREMEGVIAFQVHRGEAMKAQFRNVRLKKFKADSEKAAGTPSAKNATPKKPRGKPAAKSQSKKAQAKKAQAKKNTRPEHAKPNWIWLAEGDEPAKSVYFRKEVDSGGVGAARLYAACDDSMKIYVDGKLVREHDTWQTPVFVDISKHMDLDSPQKKHVIAVEALNGASAAGLLVKLDLESGWRDAWSIVTDESWQASKTPEAGWKTIGFKPAKPWGKAEIVAAIGGGPWAQAITEATLAAAAPLKEPTATPIDMLKVAKGFDVELLYSVPKDEDGSWVNMCHDPKGRLIVSDQYGSLYRVTPPGILGATELAVEKINVDIGEAQGLLWAFDSLYVSVNQGEKYASGLYRVRDTDGDDQLDSVETLRELQGGGEHGPHAVLPHPDGKSLVIICGNGTTLPEVSSSRVPQTWDEDLLLPRVQGRFMRGKRAPGGFICRVDPEGKNWELMATGFRNEFDGAYNADGELFAYDADMEWDFNLPWYRPTRICHVISGAEFGWRSGGGKWPTYYPDSVPQVVDIGPGSPTGVTFGYGAKFPAKYQKALFACDWSYGKLYAVHMSPKGATYSGKLEEFITGTPLPLTDAIINPHDGAMYFLIGGRRVQSGLYKVTYSGAESTAPASGHDTLQADARATRQKLEVLHAGDHADAVDAAWPHLGSTVRFVRYAARVALEHRPLTEWKDRALSEKNVPAALSALMAMTRKFQRSDKGKEPNIDTAIPDWPSNAGDQNSSARREILEALDRLNWVRLTVEQKVQVMRVLTLTFLRVGPPDGEERTDIIGRGGAEFPTGAADLDVEIGQLMVYLQAPYAAYALVEALENAPTQEEQIRYAAMLRLLKTGWDDELRERYFQWFVQASTYRGGASFATFIANIRAEAIATLTDDEKARLKPILEAKPENDAPTFTAKPRQFVKEWTMQQLVPLVQTGLKNRDFDNGRRLFGAAACFACHRFDNQGGAVGPDLTILSGRFSARDILESVVEPSKQISDQYGAVQIVTMDGKVVTGRIINLAGDSYRIQTNMLDPGALVGVDRKQIDVMMPSKTSMMPNGLLNTLNEDEVKDLMAYLLSRGDRSNAMFKK